MTAPSRMEFHGNAGTTHSTRAVHEISKNRYDLQPQDTVAIKDRGPTESCFLLSRTASRAPSPARA